MRCVTCKGIGHNTKTCQRAPMKKKDNPRSVSGPDVSTSRQANGVVTSQESARGSSLRRRVFINEKTAVVIPSGSGGRGATSGIQVEKVQSEEVQLEEVQVEKIQLQQW